MAVFTTVTEADISAWLSDFSLGTLLELQGIPAGIENTNYFVTTSQGRFVLTLFEKLTSSELPFYLNLMSHLARHGIPCPAPAARQNQRLLGELNGKPACIMSRLNGKSVEQPDASQCAALGAMLARVHLAGMCFPETLPNPRGAQWRRDTLPQVLPFLTAQDALLLRDEIDFQAQNECDTLPKGIIHADLFRDNVLLTGNEVGGLIDFYFACTDDLLYDVAITVNDWCTTGQDNLDEVRTHAFLRAYHAVRPFEPIEAERWPLTLRLAALRFWLSRLFDLHLPREGELVNAHDPDRFKHILQHHLATGKKAVWL